MGIKKGKAPLTNSVSLPLRRVKERRSLSYATIPLPLVKGKGIKGIGLIKIKGEGLANNLLITPV